MNLDPSRERTPCRSVGNGATEPSRVPDPTELRRRIPQDHPRILFRPGDFERLRGRLEEPPFRDCFEPIRAVAEAGRGQPLPRLAFPPDFYAPDSGSWDRRYPRSTESFRAHQAMMQPIRAMIALVENSSLVYRLTGEEPCREPARQAMNALAALDLTATSYHNTHAFHCLIPTLAVGLDYLWEELEPSERETIVSALTARAREFHPLSVQVALRDPLNSHAISYGPPGMAYAALALYHHEPEAEEWLRDVLTFLDCCWPGFGGEDGGWGQGFGYGDHWAMQRLMHAIYVATGVNFFDTPWSRNNGNHSLYFQPPYGNCPNFGDASYNRPKALQRQVMQVYAGVHQNPYYQWFAEQIDAVCSQARNGVECRQLFWGGHAYLLSHFLTWPPPPPAKPPRDLPQALHLRDVDWVALHSDLADGDRNVMLQFKSSHFGSFNHSHADQNSFVLEAFSHPLLIDSGYYPWYGSPHDLTWTRQTRAHNALLINGKGQGVWNRAAAGRIVAFVSTADFDYTAGDATAAYQQPSLHGAPEELCAANEGVLRVVRHIVFARPHVFVILDEVETERPAALQFLLHALHPFQIDVPPHPPRMRGGTRGGEEPGGREAQRVATIANGPALARIHLLDPGPVEISQTDQFSAPPENGSPNQWHLTCAFAPTSACRRLLTVIVVGRTHSVGNGRRAVPLPEVERLESPGKIGARIGDTAVQFRVGNGRRSTGFQPAGRQDVGATVGQQDAGATVGDFAVPQPVVGVTCCGVRADGTRTWLEYSGPFMP